MFQYFMENKKEISLEEFMSDGWSRLKQLIFAQSINNKETEHTTDDDENERQTEDGEDQDDNEDESESVDEEVKYAEPEELDESQYDEETKLIVEGNNGLSFKQFVLVAIKHTNYNDYLNNHEKLISINKSTIFIVKLMLQNKNFHMSACWKISVL